MSKKTGRAFLKALSAVTGNLSAAWFALAFVSPNFTNILSSKALITLTKDIMLGILFLIVTSIIERALGNDK